MDVQQLWRDIDAARRRAVDPEDIDAVAEALVEVLAAEPERISAADEALRELLASAYDVRLWGAAYLLLGGCSDSSFEHFRGWLIGQGKDVFEVVLRDPDSLVDHLPVGSVSYYGERVLMAAWSAYSQVFESDLPVGRDIDWPELEDDWDFESETAMRRRYPRLWGKLRPPDDELDEPAAWVPPQSLPSATARTADQILDRLEDVLGSLARVGVFGPAFTDSGVRGQTEAGGTVAVLAQLTESAIAAYIDYTSQSEDPAIVIVGDDWIVVVGDHRGDTADRVQTRLGGEIVRTAGIDRKSGGLPNHRQFGLFWLERFAHLFTHPELLTQENRMRALRGIAPMSAVLDRDLVATAGVRIRNVLPRLEVEPGTEAFSDALSDARRAVSRLRKACAGEGTPQPPLRLRRD